MTAIVKFSSKGFQASSKVFAIAQTYCEYDSTVGGPLHALLVSQASEKSPILLAFEHVPTKLQEDTHYLCCTCPYVKSLTIITESMIMIKCCH